MADNSTLTFDANLVKIKVRDDCPNRDEVLKYYSEKASVIGHAGDSGFDLICPDNLKCITDQVNTIKLGIECEMVAAGSNINVSYMLFPRSSISNTPLALANSIGLIDAGYRGELMAKVRCHIDRSHKETISDSSYTVKKAERLFQLVAFDGRPIKSVVVETLTSTSRGAAGFGSTGK